MNKKQMAEIRNYKIYKHSLPDGSAYIGVTSEEKLYNRFQYGNGYCGNSEFHNAVYELGWKEVKTEILAELTSSWYEAHMIEIEEIKKAVAAGIKLYNKEHTKLPAESRYNLDGCTILDINTYFETFAAAARFIGVTTQGIRNALQHSKVCKGWSLEYGDVTNKNNTEDLE